VDQKTLVKERIDQGARFLAELEKSLPLKAAFWCKKTEDSGWTLQVASDQIGEGDRKSARRAISEAAKTLGDPNFDRFEVRLAMVDDPLVRSVMAIRRLYPGRIAPHYQSWYYDAGYVEELYIYPLPINVPNPATAAGS
jgi:hypothetical protein